MRPWSVELEGRLEEGCIDSELLRDNPLGDPHQRPLWVYLPPGYDEGSQRLPSVYLIQGFTGQLDMWKNRAPLRKNPVELVDELFASGGAPPCVVVWVDCWTSLGGSQFVDSPATGQYMSYLCREVVPWVDARYRTLAKPEHRGIAGKSSGGYGAMVVAMKNPDVFRGLASHAGDALFEVCYGPDVREVVRALRDEYGGSYAAFWESFRARPAFSKDSDAVIVNLWAMAACYSANADGSVDLPFDTSTGEHRPEVWARWLEWDPVRLARTHGEALRSMRAIYVDAGRRDDYYLDLGAEAFRRELDAAGVKDYFFELFDATHKAIEYRYPLAVAYLAKRLGA